MHIIEIYKQLNIKHLHSQIRDIFSNHQKFSKSGNGFIEMNSKIFFSYCFEKGFANHTLLLFSIHGEDSSSNNELFEAIHSEISKKIKETKKHEPKIYSLQPVDFIDGNGNISQRKKIIRTKLFYEKIPNKVNLYYKSDSNIGEVEKQLKYTIHGLQYNIEIQLIEIINYEEAINQPNENQVNCLLLTDSYSEQELLELIYHSMNKKIIIFNNKLLGDKKKRANIVYQILSKNGSILWKNPLPIHNCIYMGIDLGHHKELQQSKLCITIYNEEGLEISSLRKIIFQDLNEKFNFQIIIDYIDQLCYLPQFNHCSNIIVHRDGKFIENELSHIVSLEKKINKNITLIDVTKSGSAFTFLSEGKYIQLNQQKYLLSTLDHQAGGFLLQPIKINVVYGNYFSNEIHLQCIYILTKIFAGDSIYGGRKLPITTYLSDLFSSFDLTKYLKAINR